jgi:hypothetical protein
MLEKTGREKREERREKIRRDASISSATGE